MFIIFGFNFVNATTEETPDDVSLECKSPQILNETKDACIDDITLIPKILICTEPQILNESGDSCIDKKPEVITCTEYQTLQDGICIDNKVIESKPDPVNIHLKIISGSLSLYDNDILVTACDSKNDGVMYVTPYCALVQSGIPSDWNDFWLNSIGDFSNDFTNNIFWMWLANLNIDNTNPSSSYNLSAKEYELKQNDQILFYYNTNPLDIWVDNTAPALNDVITITVKELGLDSSWNPIWKSSPLSKIVIGSDIFDVDTNGEYKISILNADSFTILGQKNGFIDSSLFTISPVISNEEVDNDEENIDRNSGGGGGNNTLEKTFSISDVTSFLFSNQEDDGSFGEDMYTDWGVIGISKIDLDDDSILENLRNFILENDIENGSVTDYARRAMALLSFNINPYEDTSVNYIEKIIREFDGSQIGDKNLFNDDIFSLMVLSKVGYEGDDEMIKNIVSFVLLNQESDGSFGSIDMTSAFIMALEGFKDVDGVDEAIETAWDYIINEQKEDGSFGNMYSTSWALQALSLNNSFDYEVKKGIEFLEDNQKEDGSFIDGSISNKIWATVYVLPAIYKLSWNEILEDFDKQEINNGSNNTTEEDNRNEEELETLKIEEIEKIENILVLENNISPVVVKKEKEIIPINLKELKKIENLNNGDDSSLNMLTASVGDAPVLESLNKDGFWRSLSLFFFNVWSFIVNIFI